MEKIPILKVENDIHNEEMSEKYDDVTISNEHRKEIEHTEAIGFVEKHRDFLEHYAKGRVRIEPAPKGLQTFAFDLEKNIIYVNSMFYKKQGFSDEKTLFAICHEIEHFSEKVAMLSEEGGEKKFERYLKRIKSSKAFSLSDNCVSDIRENRSVVARTNRGMGDLESMLYQEDLFPDTDLTSAPRHIQFAQALLREARVPGEKCNVHDDVRKALDEVAKVSGLMEVMTNPGTPMSLRLRLQDKYVWPKVEALLEKDLEDKKKQAEKEKGEKGESGEPEDSEESKEGGEEKEGQSGEGGENGEGESGKEKSAKGKKGKPQKSDNKKPERGDGGEDGDDPNKIFADDYRKAEEKFPEAIPLEEIEKALKEWKEERKKSSPDKADEDYAKKLGVEKKDLQNYRKIVEDVSKMVNPETDVEVMKELKDLFLRIISKRLKVTYVPKYPTEEGEELIDPAQLVADVKSGNLEPKVWQDIEIKEKHGENFGEVEITLVCDRSGSMEEGQKAIEQRKSAVMIMEVLKEFSEMCEAEKINISKPLEVRSEIYSFASQSADRIPLKKMSSELGEAERINILKKLFDLPGSTTDFNCLEAISDGINDEIKNKIKIGELKKIVIVLTDGGSDDPRRVMGVLKHLRDAGVIAVGVGITSAGQPVVSTYAPNALVVEDVSKLPIVLGDLLKEHLKDL